MAQFERYDLVVVGSGEGGKYLAWHTAQLGLRTAVVERRWIGGSCPNINCLPSKNEIYSAGVAHLVRRARDFGVSTGPTTVEMAQVLKRKREMVAALVAYHLERFATSGAELIMGEAHLVGENVLEIGMNDGSTRRLIADKLMLNLGTHAAIPSIPGLVEAGPLTNIEALELNEVPDHLVIIGGGYVGLEFAQAYRRFGSRVTVVDRGARLLHREDPEISELVATLLEQEAVEILSASEVKLVTGRSGTRVDLDIATASGPKQITGTHLLVAAGRVPNTRDVGLEPNGIELNERGYVLVNDRLETTAPNAWAIGECAGSPQFTHASLDDFRVIRDNLAGGSRSTTGRVVPYCMFIDPPLARIGLSETEAAQSGASVRVAKLPVASVLKTRATGLKAGLMKALVTDDDRIAGFSMVGADAGEVMSVVQMAMSARLPYTALRDGIFAHPTMAEGLKNAGDRCSGDWPPQRTPEKCRPQQFH
jgi:pyruvate/2-oxoglutarate dehydrogenase complex dihydrolipoamide dehydrogenase (E3) component